MECAWCTSRIPRNVAQGREPDVGPTGQNFETLRNECSIDTDKRDDIADGAKRHKIEPLEQIRLRPVRVMSSRPQSSIERDNEKECHADCGQADQAHPTHPIGWD